MLNPDQDSRRDSEVSEEDGGGIMRVVWIIFSEVESTWELELSPINRLISIDMKVELSIHSQL